MTITCASHMLRIEIDENQVPVLVLEEPGEYTDITGSFYRQTEGEDGEIIISEGDKIISLPKSVMIVSDYFSLDLNNRQIHNKLYQQMENTCVDLGVTKDEFTRQGIEILEKILMASRFDHVAYNLELEWGDIFKLFQVRIDEDYITLQEKLTSLLRVSAELLNLKLLIFVNLKAYLTEKELYELYHMAGYLKINLLMIESHEGCVLPQEKYYIVDKDRCLIIK